MHSCTKSYSLLQIHTHIFTHTLAHQCGKDSFSFSFSLSDTYSHKVHANMVFLTVKFSLLFFVYLGKE